jgi:hypothetical protein
MAAHGPDENEATDMTRTSHTARPLRTALGALLTAGLLMLAAPAHAQKAYPTPEAAADALVDAIARTDEAQVGVVLGAGYRRYVPSSEATFEDRIAFLEAWARSHRIVRPAEDRAMLEAGTHGWTLPIPIVRSAAGWRFQPSATPAELRTRRIGRNELSVIQVVLAYTDAQEEYFALNPDGRSPKHFAMRTLSSPGRRDGLYWATRPGEPDSPLGPAVAQTRAGQAYHGYRYKLLTAQGPSAPGGAKSYVRDGLMTDGYALIAWPERRGDTGVMSFIVSRDGKVHQKDLGPGTDAIARRMQAYDPDPSWSPVAPTRK